MREGRQCIQIVSKAIETIERGREWEREIERKRERERERERERDVKRKYWQLIQNGEKKP